MSSGFVERWSEKSAGREVWCGTEVKELPCYTLATLQPEIFATYSGPDSGLTLVHDLEQQVNGRSADVMRESSVAGAKSWQQKNHKAYGISMSLYDQHPITGKISGDPVADSFALCARENNAVLIVADGVNWGEKSRLASRCAVYGSMQYVNQQLESCIKTTNAATTTTTSHTDDDSVRLHSTHDVFEMLLRSLDAAQRTILHHEAGLTTLCIAFVCPLTSSDCHAVCVVSVGDSLAYVLSRHHGLREITTGSRDVSCERDIRDAGGALGPVRNGCDPELHNLTLSMTFADTGDVVFLTTDGISDNFDPVVTKIALPLVTQTHDDKAPEAAADDANDDVDDGDDEGEDEGGQRSSNEEQRSGDVGQSSDDGRPLMTPAERHQYAVKEMERLVHEFELFAESSCSAQELTGVVVQHVLKLTDIKRKVLENPDVYRRKRRLDAAEREKCDAEVFARLSRCPGKLDHATAVAYEVGRYRVEAEMRCTH